MPARDSNTTPHFPSASISSPPSKDDVESGQYGYSYTSSTSSFPIPRTSTLPVQNAKQDSFPRTITAPIPETAASRRRSLRNGGYGSMGHRSTLSPPADLSSPTSPRSDQAGYISTFMRRVSAGKSPPDQDGGRSMTRKRSQDMDDGYGHLSASARAIRDSSNRLASLSFKPRTSISSALSFTSSDPANSASPHSAKISSQASVPGQQIHHAAGPSQLSQSLTVGQISGPSSGKVTPEEGVSPMGGLTPRRDYADGAVSPQPGASGLSGLSLMMELEKARSVRGTPVLEAKELQDESTPKPSRPMSAESLPVFLEASTSPSGLTDGGVHSDEAGPVDNETRNDATSPAILIEPTREDEEHASKILHQYLSIPEADEGEEDSETSPLLGEPSHRPRWAVTRRVTDLRGETSRKWSKLTWRDIASACIADPIKTLPSVILGMLLNVLDGVSYGMILFPATPVFKGFGSLGVSMFFMSCIVSQLVFSLGGSIFPAGNGSMMIEAVPFFHILINIIQQEVGGDNEAVIATTMVAFAFSSILTGIVFFALGAFRLGTLVGYFPRHILVGCIGGVGVFLIETGLEVSRGLKEEGFQYNLPTLKLFFESPHAVLLWTIPLALAIVLRIITHFFHHQLIFPAYFFLIPVVFYIVVFAARLDLQSLRDGGWVMDVGTEAQAWWKFYTYFDFGKTNWGAFWAGIPTQLALVFFGILHVPLNVPALGVTLGEDNVKLDRELLAHGASNLAAGLTGTVPNYLTYVNSVLFYRVGGGSRLSGIMLALGTGGIMFVGPRVIGYLPVAVVAALIFVLGIDLLVEAVWDTRHKVNRMEYITIWAIAIGMTVWDFVIGLLFGIILACIFFVVQNSRRRALRAVFSGSTAKSTVRRPRPQRAFLQQVGSQTYVMKLQGFLFFGTISAVEEEIRKLLDLAKWQHNPIRFLILDFTLVAALDFSSAEAFARVQRLLSAKNVRLILCGAAPNGLVGSALQGVGLWADREGMEVEVFGSLNESLEWSENAYLTAFYENQLALEQDLQETRSQIIDFPKVDRAPFSLAQSFQNSPRRTHLAKAGGETLPKTYIPLPPEDPPPASQPLPLLEQTLGSYAPSLFSSDAYRALVPYFHQAVLSPGQTLWKQDESPDGLYLIEHGALRATYLYADHGRHIVETMVAGTIAGDLSTLSDTPRNTTAVAERECVLWKLSRDELGRMEREDPRLAMKLVQVVLKAVAEEQDVLASCILLQSTL